MIGQYMSCFHCAGIGQVPNRHDPNVPEECLVCNGSGHVWRYRSGVIAQYYGGPFLGREPIKSGQ